MDWQATDLNASWRYAFVALVRQDPAFADPAQIAASARTWNANMRILEQQLTATGGYAVGDVFTLADVVLGLSVNRWVMTPIDHADCPAVRAYYERLSEHPGFRAHGRNGFP